MAGRLILHWKPLEGVPGGSAEAATWGEFHVTVEAAGRRHVLTRVHDSRAETTRDRVVDTVLPLAEWLARNWAALVLADRLEPDPNAPRRQRYEWERAHAWRFAGDGAALPALRFVPIDESTVALRWSPDELASLPESTPVAFITPAPQDSIDALTEGVASSLRSFVDSVIRRLRERAPEAPRTRELEDAWRLASDTTHPDHAALVLAAQLGIGWQELDPGQVDALKRAAARDSPIDREAVGAVGGVDALPAGLAFADDVKRRCNDAASAPTRWIQLGQQLAGARGRHAPPWTAGWAAAKRLREVIGFPADRVGFRPEKELGFALEDGGSTPLEVDSFVSWVPGHAPVRWLGESAGGKGRFAATRDLYAAIFDGQPEREHARAFARERGGIRSVANAFATELIAPIEAVKARLRPSRRPSQQEVEAIAAELDAPSLCVFHQIQNRLGLRVGA